MKTNTSLTDQKILIQRLAKIVTEDSSIQLQPSTGWKCDLENKILYYREAELLNSPPDIILAILMHEIGHFLHSDMSTKLKFESPKSLYFNGINAVEDIRVNRLVTEEFPGVERKMKRLYTETLSSAEIGKFPPYMQALWNVANLEYSLPTSFTSNEAEEAFNSVSDSLKECFVADSTISLSAIFKTSIWPVLKDLITEKEDAENEESNSTDPQDNSDPTGNSNNNSDEDNPFKDKLVSSSSTQNSSDPLQNKRIELSKIMEEEGSLTEYLKAIDEIHNPTETKTGISVKRQIKCSDKYPTYEELKSAVEPYIRPLAKYIGSILKDNAIQRWHGRCRSGRLSRRGLDRFLYPDYKLFQRKTEIEGKDYALTLLIDESYSMTGNNKDRKTVETLILLAEACNIAGLPFEIEGFNYTTRIYKGMEESFGKKHKNNIESILEEIKEGNSGYTNDAWAINGAMKRLSKYGKHKRLLFILCDGGPNPGGEGSNFDLKTEVYLASKESICIGVGLEYDGDSLAKYYENYLAISNVSMLATQITSLLKTLITRN